MAKFRFQDLKIWQLAIEIASDLFDVADELEQKNYTGLRINLEGLECPCQTI